MGAKDWHSLDQLAKNSTIQVTRLSRSSSSCRRGVGLSGGQRAEPPGTPRGGDTHIDGLVTEILDVLGAHVEGGLAGHQEHCNDSAPEPSPPPSTPKAQAAFGTRLLLPQSSLGQPRQSEAWGRQTCPSRRFLSPPITP